MANQTKITAESGKQEIFIEREFDAPRELVFKACTDPELVTKWWGVMPGHSTKVDKAIVRSGGEWRYIHTDPQGQSIGFHGVYHEVLKPSRLIETFEWEGLPETGHVILQTTKLEELPENRCKLYIQQVFQSVTDRDGMVQSGQKGGLEASHAQLEKLLEKLQK